MHRHSHASAPFQLFLLVLTLVALGCSASYIRARVPDNPLQRVAQQAQEDWSVEQVNENSLQLRDSWPIYSVLALGYGASQANLFYDLSGSELSVQYYFEGFPLMTLWIPISIDAEPGFFGLALKPIMNRQIDDILRWSGATITSRRSGPISEAFPQKGNKPLPPDK